jgi:proteasome accessory factor A
MRTLMGVETEYAVGAVTGEGARVEPSTVAERMLAATRRAYPHLPDAGGYGIFLANGARLYIDRGDHPEFATPECGDPWEALRYLRAGEALMADLAQRVGPEFRGGEVRVFRANVDYANPEATWGCHESYLHRAPPSGRLARHLLPHLVSRVIYAGAGGFRPGSRGLEFTLSPRAHLLVHDISGSSTGDRGIFHTKTESLGRPGWHRVHLLSGESLCSDTATVLKLGTTALVLAAMDAGAQPGRAVSLVSPVLALQAFAEDPSLRRTVPRWNGRCLTALDLQRHYLAEVETCRARGHLPPWADNLCRLWADTLDALERGPEAVSNTLDWAMKLALFRRWADRGAIPWDALGVWTRALAGHGARHPESDPGPGSGPPPPGADLAGLRRSLERQGLRLEDLCRFRRSRHELMEADLRFGQLAPPGIFLALEHQGVLRHGAGGPPAPRRWLGEAPAGRARLRGEWVRRLWARGEGADYRSDWTGIWSDVHGRQLDLSHPLLDCATWQSMPPPPEVGLV